MQLSSCSLSSLRASRSSRCIAVTASAADAPVAASKALFLLLTTVVALAVTLVLSATALAQVIAPSKTIPVHRSSSTENVDPEIESVKSTPRGYVIVGRGFSSDPSKVKVFENGAPVQDTAVMGASDSRISVFSVPTGRTGVSVQVGSLRSPAAYFTHVEPRARDDDPVEGQSNANLGGAYGGQARAKIQPLPASRRGQGNMVTKRQTPKSDGYLAREVLRLRDRVEMLEEELLMIRSQLGISSR